jgi:hypothetical protein
MLPKQPDELRKACKQQDLTEIVGGSFCWFKGARFHGSYACNCSGRIRLLSAVFDRALFRGISQSSAKYTAPN